MPPAFLNVSVQYLKTIRYFKIVGSLGVVSKNFSFILDVSNFYVFFLGFGLKGRNPNGPKRIRNRWNLRRLKKRPKPKTVTILKKREKNENRGKNKKKNNDYRVKKEERRQRENQEEEERRQREK